MGGGNSKQEEAKRREADAREKAEFLAWINGKEEAIQARENLLQAEIAKAEEKSKQATIESEEVKQLRGKIKSIKPGDLIRVHDQSLQFPDRLQIGLYGTTGVGKTSLVNTIQYAVDGQFPRNLWHQKAPANYHGGHSVRMKNFVMTDHLRVIDTRGVTPEELKDDTMVQKMISQIEGRESYAEIIDWKKKSEGGNIDPDKRIYCPILVFSATVPETVYKVLKKFVTALHDWEGRFPIAVLTKVDLVTPKELEDMKVVLHAVGISDIYEVANLTEEHQHLDYQQQLTILQLLERCFVDGDNIIELREQIERSSTAKELEK